MRSLSDIRVACRWSGHPCPRPPVPRLPIPSYRWLWAGYRCAVSPGMGSKKRLGSSQSCAAAAPAPPSACFRTRALQTVTGAILDKAHRPLIRRMRANNMAISMGNVVCVSVHPPSTDAMWCGARIKVAWRAGQERLPCANAHQQHPKESPARNKGLVRECATRDA